MIESSDRTCPRCGKRMMVDRGQDDESRSVRMLTIHECWSCDWSEREYPTRPKLRVIRGGAA